MGVPFSPLRTCPPASSDLAVTAPAWVGVAAVERVQREVQGVAAAVVPAALEIVRQDALARLPGLPTRKAPKPLIVNGLQFIAASSSLVASLILNPTCVDQEHCLGTPRTQVGPGVDVGDDRHRAAWEYLASAVIA